MPLTLAAARPCPVNANPLKNGLILGLIPYDAAMVPAVGPGLGSRPDMWAGPAV